MDKENDIIYTAQDIDAYLSGRLTALQMHAMEKAALDDSFLAEAMEGYAAVDNKDWEGQLVAVKKNFVREEKNNTAIVVPIAKKNNNWWKVAAAVIVLAGTATFSYLVLNKKEKTDIAQEVKTPNPVPPTVLNDTTKIPTTTAPVITNEAVVKNKTTASKPIVSGVTTASDEELEKSKSFASVLQDKNPAINEGDVAVLKKSTTVASERNDDAIKQEAKAKARDVVAPVVASAPAKDAKYFAKNYTDSSIAFQKNAAGRKAEGIIGAEGYSSAKEKSVTPLSHSFKGVVLAPDNTPLPFANVSIKKENFGTYADVKGNFNLVSSDSFLLVEVKAAGYQPKFYTLQSFAQQNKIVLAEDNSVKYNTVVADQNATASRSKTSRRATLLKDSVVNVEPADGWDNYNSYVDNNIEIPDDILSKNIHGQVELSFDIKPNGAITNIKVDKSLCDNCDEVAKRLLQQGPQWKLKKGKKGKGKVTVQF